MNRTTTDILAEGRAIADAWADLSPDDLDAALAGFADTSDDKLRALRAVAMAADSTAALYEAEAAPLLAVAAAHKRTVARVKASALALLHRRRELDLPVKLAGVVSLRGNGGALPLVFAPDVPLPYEYTRAVPEPDNAKIREALEAGTEIPGVAFGARGESVAWAK